MPPPIPNKPPGLTVGAPVTVSQGELPESPLVGSSNVGAGVTGTSAGDAGVSGRSLGPEITPGTFGVPGDGVYGQGQNGVHGLNGLGAGTPPKFGCGVFGESDSGFGIYAASKTNDAVHGVTASSNAGVSGNNTGTGPGVSGINTGTGPGIYGTSTTGNAGQFSGNVAVTGALTAMDVILTGADCAEEFDAHQGAAIEPGSVVAFDDRGALITSNQPYNKRVAGVVSGAGSYRPGVNPRPTSLQLRTSARGTDR